MKTVKMISLFVIAFVTLAFTSKDLFNNGGCSIPATDLEQLPEFEAELLDSGKTFDSKDLNGNYVLVDVWSPSCGVCVEHVPALQELNKKYSSKNFEIVSFALSSKEKVKQFRQEKYPMPWKHALAEKSRDGEIVQALEVKSTPTYYLVSPEGKILADNDDFQEAEGFASVIDQHL